MVCTRTDAEAANLLTSDHDANDRPFLTGERTQEGFFRVKNGLEQAISRGVALGLLAEWPLWAVGVAAPVAAALVAWPAGVLLFRLKGAYFAVGSWVVAEVLVPTQEAIEKLVAARFAADIMGVPTIVLARTDAEGAP